MLTLLLVRFGGGLVSISGFGFSEFLYRVFGKSLTHGVLILIFNILRCLLVGALAAFSKKMLT